MDSEGNDGDGLGSGDGGGYNWEMTVVFDGRKFARKIEEGLPRVKAKLVVLLDPKNEAGVKYVEMKKRMADRLGVEMRIFDKPEIERWNADASVNGIVIQLPFPDSDKLINLIDPKKDVDGLRKDGPFKPAVVRAVMEILGDSLKETPFKSVLVVGSRGFVGRRLVKELRCKGMDKEDFEPEKIKKADVVISCTGQEGLITGEMVKDGFIAIDVGYPKAEFTKEALAKARFYTPVPGGVGPVTVACLFANLVEGVNVDSYN